MNCRRLLLLLALASSACSTLRPALVVGLYGPVQVPGVASYTGKTLRLLPNQRFEYYQYSDSPASDTYGAGNYELCGRQLRLTFNGQSLEQRPSVLARPLTATLPDSLTLTFRVWGADGREAPQPLVGGTVLARDTAARVMEGRAVDGAGRATLRIAHSRLPQLLTISAIGWQTLVQPWPTHDTAYEVWLPPDLGALYAVGMVIEFRVLDRAPDHLVLRRGRGTTTLALRPR